MSYSVTEKISDSLSFICADGKITLYVSNDEDDNTVASHLSHVEMQKLVVLWLKCTDMEFTPMQKVTLNLDLDVRRSK